MKSKKDVFPIDLNITPQNANKKNYEFVCDVNNPYEAIRELLEFTLSKGYIFGTSSKDEVTHLGLYRKKIVNKNI